MLSIKNIGVKSCIGNLEATKRTKAAAKSVSTVINS